MKSVRKRSTILILLLSGSGNLLPMMPQPARESLAATITKYGLLGTGVVTLAMTLAQRRVPSLSTFAKTGAVVFALSALYKLPELIRTLSSSNYPVHMQEEIMSAILRAEGVPKPLFSMIGSYSDFHVAREIKVIPDRDIGKRIIKAAEFNSDGTAIVTAVADQLTIARRDQLKRGQLNFWNSKTGQLINQVDLSLRALAISNISGKDQFAIAVDWDLPLPIKSSIKIYRAGEEVYHIKDILGIIYSVNFDAAGNKMAAGGLVWVKNPVYIWEISSEQRKPIEILTHHVKEIVDVNFSTKGDKIITASEDGTACVFEISSGEKLLTLLNTDIPIVRARFNADDTKIVTVDASQMAWIWDAATGQRLCSLGHNCLSACFSPTDPTLIVAAFKNGNACIFRIKNNECKQLQMLKENARQVMIASFSPDGTQIVTAGEDGTVCIWRQPFAQPKKQESLLPKQLASNKQQEAEDKAMSAPASNEAIEKVLRELHKMLAKEGLSPEDKNTLNRTRALA